MILTQSSSISMDCQYIYTSCSAPLRSVGRLRRHWSPLSKAPAAPITFPRRLRRITGAFGAYNLLSAFGAFGTYGSPCTRRLRRLLLSAFGAFGTYGAPCTRRLRRLQFVKRLRRLRCLRHLRSPLHQVPSAPTTGAFGAFGTYGAPCTRRRLQRFSKISILFARYVHRDS